MKYFINSQERKTSEHENYIEFQTSEATEEFWDKTSLYMSYDSLKKSKLDLFLSHCVHKDILFDCETISKEDWQTLLKEAEFFDNNAYDAILELYEWSVEQFKEEQNISLIWEYERILINKPNDHLAK